MCLADELKRSLVSCSIRPSLQRVARQVTSKILSSDVVDRLRLFIKPSDLVDGVSKLSVSERVKEQDSDGKPVAVFHKERRFFLAFRISRRPYLEVQPVVMETLDSLIGMHTVR